MGRLWLSMPAVVLLLTCLDPFITRHVAATPESVYDAFVSPCAQLSAPIPAAPKSAKELEAQPAISGRCGEIIPGFYYAPASNIASATFKIYKKLNTPALCAAQCNKIKGCNGFVLVYVHYWCYIKKNLGTRTFNAKADSWVKCTSSGTANKEQADGSANIPTTLPFEGTCSTAMKSYMYAPFTTQTSTSLLLGTTPKVTVAECAALSTKSAAKVGGAKGFTYNVATSTCYLYSAMTSSAISTTTNSFVFCDKKRPGLALAQMQGYKLWSDAGIWSNNNFVVPGKSPTSLTNATIPCGVAVLLDESVLYLHTLRVKGLLRVWDNKALPTIYISTHFVVNEGQIQIGDDTQHFTQHITFELTPNSENLRAPTKFTSFEPADVTSPRNMGHKSFATVGGSLRLYGMPGGDTTPHFVKLIQTAKVGDTSIVVSGDVSAWPIGSKIVVASTDYDSTQAELFSITKISKSVNGKTTISLDAAFVYMHWGDLKGLSDGFGGYIDQTAEVALLSKRIVIKGTEEGSVPVTDPYYLQGGHFMVYYTPLEQHVVGVEFYNMGQQGSLGRYPIHFHILYSVPKNLCRLNTVWHSKQRCIVLHLVFNMTVDSNVAYDTAGHCFITEEGGERHNTFSNNIGIQTTAARLLIGDSTDKIEGNTDDKASTFWNSNPDNHFINNTAAGSIDSGIWMEFRDQVRGNTKFVSWLNTTKPKNFPMGVFYGNTVHSNKNSGVRNYPHGQHATPGNLDGGFINTIEGLKAWKNRRGMFMHRSTWLVLKGSTFSDHLVGAHMSEADWTTVDSCIFVGQTTNYGNPKRCYTTDTYYKYCIPISGCTMPLAAGVAGRSISYHQDDKISMNNAGWYGFVFEAEQLGQNASYFVNLTNSKFSNYASSCTNTSAITLISDSGSGYIWNPSFSIKGLEFAATANPIWMNGLNYQLSYPYCQPYTSSDQARFFTLYDADGSMVGGKGGYAVAALEPALLPPAGSGITCTYKAAWNGYSCPGACYRGVIVSYSGDPGIKACCNANCPITKFSYLEVVRVADGKTFTVSGNTQGGQCSTTYRFFSFALLTGYSYRIYIRPPAANPTFFPTTITVSNGDMGYCGGDLTLLIQNPTAALWTTATGANVYYTLCPGTAVPVNAIEGAQFSQQCNTATKTFFFRLDIGWSSPLEIDLTQTAGSPACTGTEDLSCGVVFSSSQWLYDASGLERRPGFYTPSTTLTTWSTGFAPFGYYYRSSPPFNTWLPAPTASLVTYYYRTTFQVTKASCYSAMYIGVSVQDGVVLYLNGVEVLRSGMPTTSITTSTLALSRNKDNIGDFDFFTVPLVGQAWSLVSGINTLAAEEHVYASNAYWVWFDLEMSLVSTCTF
eukprot:TRINITY_DN23152_c0_g1_i1.p1 TRINITY_DN23152_c0_g1~~TRINITY_DN23152_c0_g1_i1.p1  ORF type:complete len:1355 (+),score=152.80 TRINITY_DN23152_c0_g1_i1:1043-5107(+)